MDTGKIINFFKYIRYVQYTCGIIYFQSYKVLKGTEYTVICIRRVNEFFFLPGEKSIQWTFPFGTAVSISGPLFEEDFGENFIKYLTWALTNIFKDKTHCLIIQGRNFPLGKKRCLLTLQNANYCNRFSTGKEKYIYHKRCWTSSVIVSFPGGLKDCKSAPKARGEGVWEDKQFTG